MAEDTWVESSGGMLGTKLFLLENDIFRYKSYNCIRCMYRHGYCCHKVMETLLIVFRLVARFFCLVISLCGSNSRMWMPWRKISHRSSYEGRTACHTKVSRLLFGCFQMFNVYVSGITDAYICECECNDKNTDDNDIIYIYILSSVTWMCLILSNTHLLKCATHREGWWQTYIQHFPSSVLVCCIFMVVGPKRQLK